MVRSKRTTAATCAGSRPGNSSSSWASDRLIRTLLDVIRDSASSCPWRVGTRPREERPGPPQCRRSHSFLLTRFGLSTHCLFEGLLHHSDRGSQYAQWRLPVHVGTARHHLQYEPPMQLRGQPSPRVSSLEGRARSRRDPEDACGGAQERALEVPERMMVTPGGHSPALGTSPRQHVQGGGVNESAWPRAPSTDRYPESDIASPHGYV
jgi:hypothetical protein